MRYERKNSFWPEKLEDCGCNLPIWGEREQTCVQCGKDRKSKGNQMEMLNRLLDIREGIQGRGLVGD